MTGERANIPESVRHRLRNKSRETGMPPDALLQFYAMERFLYRLGQSPHRDRFVLKGALMLLAWRVEHMRPTRDIDLLGFADNTEENLARMVTDICNTVVPQDDGMQFDCAALQTERIKEDAEYEGVRIVFPAYLGSTRLSMRIDVGIDDAIVPAPETVNYPTLLDDPRPELKGYTPASVVAEKFEAMVKLGSVNSRMKDFFDIWLLSHQFPFNGPVLSEAVKATFERRGTLLDGLPVTLDAAFSGREAKQVQWAAFLRKSGAGYTPSQFQEVASSIAAFMGPVVDALSQETMLYATWKAGGPWGDEP